MPLPTEPPIWTSTFPGTGGSIGAELEDFVVDEVPLYAPSGNGAHVYVRVRKRGRTTQELVRAVARAAGVETSEIGTAGMKDKHAVTTQWISVPDRAAPPDAWSLGEDFEVVDVARHANKLRTGHLSGNRFRIRLVGVRADAASVAQGIVSDIAARGLPNFFGAQRFGIDGKNLDRALEWASGRGRGRVPPFERKLFASVLQAEVFNRYAMLRLGEDLDSPLAGEVVRLSGSRAVFVVLEPEAEALRWRASDILPTGPIFGPKMKAARGRPSELEQAALSALGLDGQALSQVARFADGTRRDLFVHPAEVALLEDGPASLVLSFFLPAGSYATLLVRELTRAPFFGDSR